MNKVNTKKITITWAIILLISVIAIILSSITIAHANQVLYQATSKVILPSEIINTANAQKAFCTGIIAFSIVTTLIGLYIVYTGIKTWNYQALV
ncbi:hypothetical protein [Mycoplasmopsis opalescens]|uniref:hypothetical protein n=1 Tax=Mycoplasmopsis opalescens TaxID=114886 RepID=UPI0004A73EEC|nr:hypothetical protein [Mycoplasmopsis opalescens]